jgi:hypothetical protein
VRPEHDHDYEILLKWIERAIPRHPGPIFVTDTAILNVVYLFNLPSERAVHDCSACRRFIERYGVLATVNDAGDLDPLIWKNAAQMPEFYSESALAMNAHVRAAKITGVFLTKETTWGQPETGSWRHMAVMPPAEVVYTGFVLTPGQAMAVISESVKTVRTALAEFTVPLLDQALRVLESGHLDRAEKFLAPVRWLRALHDRPKGRRGENLLWRAVATAPDGYCHPRASVIAPLLADILAGVPFEVLRSRHAAKVESTRYQRPQVAPAAGNIAAAEQLVAKLGIERSLERRFARLDELETTWTPRGPAPAPRSPSAGVFGHLPPKSAHQPAPLAAIPPATMTWAKFARERLQSAERIHLLVPQASGRFLAFTTAADRNAPPILKWDREEARNTVAWYVHARPSSAATWNLSAKWTEVEAVVPMPTMWGDQPMPFVSDGVVLILHGMQDRARAGRGNALFPECLRAELHGARATIEAYSAKASLGEPEGSACGYDIRKGSDVGCSLRVLTGGAWAEYRIDRWD